jgi:hypothetical protein
MKFKRIKIKPLLSPLEREILRRAEQILDDLGERLFCENPVYPSCERLYDMVDYIRTLARSTSNEIRELTKRR